MSDTVYDIIIIGAGTAGMTSAVYARRAGKKVLVIEGSNFGGQILFAQCVENFPSLKKISGTEFASNLFDQALELGAEFELDRVTGIEKSGALYDIITESGSHKSRSIIIATGVKHRKLGLEKEERFTGEGVSYCALCDGAFFKDREAAVVGGGNTALQDALFLSSLCKKVYIIHRRDSFRGEKALIECLREKENIEFLTDSVVKELLGEKQLEGIMLYNNKTGESRRIKLNGLFVAVGNEPDNGAFSGIVLLDENGYVKAGEDCITSEAGIFAAGDCRTKKIRQLVTAAGDGATAATAACEYLEKSEFI